MKKNILNIENFLEKFDEKKHKRCLIDDQLGAVLNSLPSSHNVVFVFDENDNFKGLISPNWSFYQKKYPYDSSVEKALIRPPELSKKNKIYDVARSMIFLRAYTLPVFDLHQKSFDVISANNIINGLPDNPDLIRAMEKYLKIRKPITIDKNSTVGEAYQLMRTRKISRIIVIDQKGKAVGIVSRRDIEPIFASTTPRQRFGRRRVDLHYVSYYDREKIKKNQTPLSTYYKRNLLFTRKTDDKKHLLYLMKKNKRNAIALLDSQFRPSGFLTRRDILSALSRLKPLKKTAMLKIADTESKLSVVAKNNLRIQMQNFIDKKKKFLPIDRVEVFIETILNTAGQVNIYDLTSKIFLKNGDILVAHGKKRDLKDALRESTRKISKQIRK